jgi:hypothetical protein
LAKNAPTGKAATRKPNLLSKPAKLSLSLAPMVRSTKNLALDLDQDLAAKSLVVILTRALTKTLVMTLQAMTPATMASLVVKRPRRSLKAASLPQTRPLPRRESKRNSDKRRRMPREFARRRNREKERKEREEPERKGKERKDMRLRRRREKKKLASRERRKKPSAREKKKRKRLHARLLSTRRDLKKRSSESKKRGSARRL